MDGFPSKPTEPIPSSNGTVTKGNCFNNPDSPSGGEGVEKREYWRNQTVKNPKDGIHLETDLGFEERGTVPKRMEITTFGWKWKSGWVLKRTSHTQ